MNTNDIKSSFQMLTSCISGLNIKNNFVSINDGDKDINREFGVTYDFGEIQKNDDDSYLGCINLHVKVIIKKETDEENSSFDLSLDITGFFIASKIKSEDEFKKLLGINGCTCLYSISRATIIDISSQALSDGKIVLPMINTFKLVESK